MTSSDASAVLSTITWDEENVFLKDLVAKNSLPQSVKVAKGQYLNIGVPSIGSPSACPLLLLSGGGKRLKVAAQCVKFKDSRRVVSFGPKLAIPDTFDGYFEILSEEGRSVKPMETVGELARRFPDSCLVRDSVKAFVSRSDDVDTITDRSRTVHAGETLVLVGEVKGTKNRRFLRCFDSKGENIYFAYEQKGKFSAIAKEDNISGVHSIKNLLNKRLPLMVRLLHGKPPIRGKACSHFLPEMRLYASFEEECVMAMSLQKEGSIVPISASAPLKLQVASNGEEVGRMKEFLRLCEKCSKLMNEAADRIHVFDVNICKEVRKDSKIHQLNNGVRRRKGSSSTQYRSPPDILPADEYDEIDQIYDYVRGFAPLPKNIKVPFSKQQQHPVPDRKVLVVDKLPPDDSGKPEPPPIETIPSRRPQIPSEPIDGRQSRVDKRVGEKRTRKASHKTKENKSRPKEVNTSDSKPMINNKLFIKSSNLRTQKPRIFRHKSASPLKEGIYYPLPGSVKSGSPSPIFNIRYKSLTNLAMDFDTLDSSNSGGKTSGDSAGSGAIKAKLPEKRSRLLHRPKSLTNLVWDFHANPTTAMEAYMRPNLIMDADRRLRLEPGVYRRNSKDSPPVILNNATNKLSPGGHKKIGTLYL